MKIIAVFFILLSGLQVGYSANSLVLTEGLIKQHLAQSPPSVEQIEASFLSVKREELAKREALGLRLNASSQFYKSNEKLLSNFDGGVVQSATQYSVGVSKPTRYGLNLGLTAFSDKSSNAFIRDAASTGLSLSLSMDLFKNFLGKRTDNDLKRSALSVKRAGHEKVLALKTFETNLRKLYWSLVANSEQRRLLSSLADLAEKQYKEAMKRRKSGVADAGEVARYRSQWTTRKASLLSLRYRKSEIHKALKHLLPELNENQLILGPYSVEKTVQSVLACTAKIGTFSKAPLELTLYDEIVELLNQENVYEQKVIQAHDSPEVILKGEYTAVGRDMGLAESRDNWGSHARSRSSLGLQISIPIDGRSRDTREVTLKMAKNRYRSQARDNLAKIRAFHTETVAIIDILKDVARNQKETNKYLEQSLKVSQKKYKQARIGLQELISERDSHLQSRLNEIDTNLTIIHTLMDYFSIYTDMPCELNRI